MCLRGAVYIMCGVESVVSQNVLHQWESTYCFLYYLLPDDDDDADDGLKRDMPKLQQQNQCTILVIHI